MTITDNNTDGREPEDESHEPIAKQSLAELPKPANPPPTSSSRPAVNESQPSDERLGRTRAIAQLAAQHDAIGRVHRKARLERRRLEKKVHKCLRRLIAATGDAEARAAEVAKLEALVTRLRRLPVRDRTHPEDLAGPWLAKGVAIGAAVAAVLGLWVVDSTLLLVLRLPTDQTRFLTAVLVAGSAVSGFVAGVTRKRWITAESPQLQISTFERVVGIAAITVGIAIEIGLAAVRAVVSQALTSALLLGAAGVGLWLVVAYLTFLAHDGLASKAKRAAARLRRAIRRLTRRRVRVDRRTAAVEQSRNLLASAAGARVTEAQDLIDAAVDIHRSRHPEDSIDTTRGVPWVDELTAIRDKKFEACCKLPSEKVTS